MEKKRKRNEKKLLFSFLAISNCESYSLIAASNNNFNVFVRCAQIFFCLYRTQQVPFNSFSCLFASFSPLLSPSLPHLPPFLLILLLACKQKAHIKHLKHLFHNTLIIICVCVCVYAKQFRSCQNYFALLACQIKNNVFVQSIGENSLVNWPHRAKRNLTDIDLSHQVKNNSWIHNMRNLIW